MMKLIIGFTVAANIIAGMTYNQTKPLDVTDESHLTHAITVMQPTPETIAQRETDWMTSELILSADQVTKVSAINIKYAEMQMEMFQGGPPRGEMSEADREVLQSQMAKIAAQKRTELEPIFTADQLQKYDEYLANRPAGGRGGFGGPPPNQQ